ncbi:MAG: GerMN domain-containing protein [Lachnospiraceae bacterium]|nr:GerMN domain-containing protein [Lachnospiraceae bacterium]
MRKISKVLFLSIVVMSVWGCGSGNGQSAKIILEDGQIGLYCIDSESQGLVQEVYTPQEKDTLLLVEELMQQLREQPKEFSYRSAISEDVNLLGHELQGEHLILNLGESYYRIDTVSEVLCRAAIVQTLLQIEGIDGIEFMVGNQPLADRTGNIIGLMTRDTFVDVSISQNNSYQETELNLYFSDTDGTGLILVKRKMLHNTNMPMEELIVEQLLKGIDSEESAVLAKTALPSDTKLLNIYTRDGVCYVNFDENFVNQTTDVSEEVIIYSVVNSLTELPSVNQVQISVNGVSNRIYKENINLNTMFERNTSYLGES